jgi:hypothetical protein
MTVSRFENIAARVTLLKTNEAGDITPVSLYRESRKRRRRRNRQDSGTIPACASDCGCKTWALKLCKSPLLGVAAGRKIMTSMAGCG